MYSIGICLMTNTQTPPPTTTVVNSTEDVLLSYHLGPCAVLKETVHQVEPPAEDPLYNVYCKTTTAKELWESLESKYKTEDAGTKKFVANMVEHVGLSSRSNSKGKGNDKKSKGKSEYLAPKAGIVKQKF
ncbi:hypothetical protein Tco_0114957 [Tanacetum coccineum]